MPEFIFSAMDDRIIDIETQLAYQARDSAELNAIVIQLRDKVEYMEKKLSELTQTIRDTAPGQFKEPGEESPPPHY